MKRNRLRRGRLFGAAVGLIAVVASAACAGEIQADTSDGEFSFAVPEPTDLMPGSSHWVPEAMFAPLVRLAEDGSLEFVHAESIESHDQRVWTVTIKPDWTFHNGEVITAQHYVDTMNLVGYGPNAFIANHQLGGIEGYEALNPVDGKPTATELTGVEVVGDTTFRITLTNPDSEFVYRFAIMGAFTALPSVAFDDLEAYGAAPVGSGPFRMDGTWEHNVAINVTRYEEYKGPRPIAERISFRIYQAADAAYTDLVAGAVDIIGGAVSIPSGRLEQLEADLGADQVLVGPSNSVAWIGLPIKDPRFADVRVRRALSMAIDREGLNRAFYGGVREPATGLYPPGFVGGGTDICGTYCAYDPDGARTLLDEAGGFDGELVIYFNGNLGQQEYYEAIANAWSRDLGIETTLRTYPNPTAYFDAIRASEDLRGPVDGGWGSTIPLPSYVLNAAFKCTSQWVFLAGGYCDEATEAAMGVASTLPDEERVAAFDEIEKAIIDQLWTIPIHWSGSVFAFGDGVENVKAKPLSPLLDYLQIRPVD